MKVEEYEPMYELTFEVLDPGEVFILDDEFYMVLNPRKENGGVNAVTLEDGETRVVKPKTRISYCPSARICL